MFNEQLNNDLLPTNEMPIKFISTFSFLKSENMSSSLWLQRGNNVYSRIPRLLSV